MSELRDSAAAAEKSVGTKDFLQDAGPRYKQSLSISLNEVIRYYTEDEFSYDSSLTKPQTLVVGGRPAYRGKGGFVVWSNDVFPSDFFVRQSDLLSSSKSKLVSTLPGNLQKQPWFAWDSKTAKLVYSQSGAAQQILTKVVATARDHTKLPLFRGTTPYEALVFQVNREIEQSRLVEDWRERLTKAFNENVSYAKQEVESYEKLEKDSPGDFKSELKEAVSGYKRVLNLQKKLTSVQGFTGNNPEQVKKALRLSLAMLLNQGDFLGLFTTPDRSRAELFSKGQVIEFVMSVDKLQEALKSGEAYIGFESFEVTQAKYQPAIEIALFSLPKSPNGDAIIELIFQSFAEATPTAASTIFN